MTSRSYRFRIRKSAKNGKFYWKLIAPNGEPCAGGLEPFASKRNAVRSIRSMVVRLEHSYIEGIDDVVR